MNADAALTGGSDSSAGSAAGTPAVDAVNRSRELPAELAEIVRVTVKRTRLRRSERRAIRDELTAHFADGLAAGATSEALHRSFGEPKLAARLMRTSSIAKRGSLDRAFGVAWRCTWRAAALLAVIYVTLAVRFMFVEPTIAFDPAERIAAIMPTTSGAGPAWPLYRESLGWAQDLQRTQNEAGESFSFDLVADSTKIGTPEWDEVADALRYHREEIDRLRAATALPVLGFPVIHEIRVEDAAFFRVDPTVNVPKPPEQRSAFSILLPHFTALRTAARLLAADAAVSAADGDGLRAAHDLAAMLEIAGHSEEHGFLVSQLVGTAIRDLMSQRTLSLLEHADRDGHGKTFDEQALSILDSALASALMKDHRLDFSVERIGFEDVLQRCYTDDGEGNGRFIPQAYVAFGLRGIDGLLEEPVMGAVSILTGPASSVVVADRRDMLGRHDDFLAAMEAADARPLWEYDFQADRWFTPNPSRFGTMVDPFLVFNTLAPALDRIVPSRKLGRARLETARTVVALCRFRAAEQRWPDALEQLVPRFLAAVPPDPFDGFPLRYAVVEGDPMLWSIGMDRVDDAGREAVTVDGPDREAAGKWRSRRYAEAVKRQVMNPANQQRDGHILYGDWLIFAPGKPVLPEPAPKPGQVSHFAG